MKKLLLIAVMLTSLLLQGCAYEAGYALGTATRYAGVAAVYGMAA